LGLKQGAARGHILLPGRGILSRTAVLIPLLCAALYGQISPGVDARLKTLQDKANAALGRRDTAAAVAALQEGLKLDPNWKDGLWTLGWTLFRDAKYDAARPVFVSLLRLDQSKAGPWLLLGLCEFEGRDYGMALDDLQHGRALGIPADLGIAPAVRYHIAVGLALGGKYEGALELLEQAALTDEHTPEVVLATGLASMRIPVPPQDAPDVFGKAQIGMLREVGEALFEGARRNRAATGEIYARLFKSFPDTAKLHHSYAYFLIGTGDLAKAESEFRAELGVDPDSVLARCGIAYILLERGEAEQAAQTAREAVRIDPGAATARFLLGKALLRSGKAADSIPELETARELEPQSSKVRFALVQAYREVDRSEDAQREANEFERLRQVEDQIKVRGQAPAALLDGSGQAAQPRK